MEPDDILSLLGRPASDPAVEAALVQFRIWARPELELDEDDADGPVVEAQDWVLNSDAGIEFGFDDEAYFQNLDPIEYGQGPMIVTQIYFYGKHELVQPYMGRFPFGLSLTDDRQTVRQKMSARHAPRRSYIRDTWELPDVRVTVGYTDDDTKINFVVCLLRPPVAPPVDDRAVSWPGIDAIVALLACDRDDPAFDTALAPLRIGWAAVRRDDDRRVSFRPSRGFELIFARASGAGVRSGAHRPSALAEVTFFRAGELDATQWRGPLPFDLGFDDSPETAIRKVGRPPDEQGDEVFTGFALWHLADFSLHLYYSSMENLLLRVRILAPGVWAAYQA